MAPALLFVPKAFVLASDLTDADKLIWMIDQAYPGLYLYEVAALARLSMPAVRKSRAALKASGWLGNSGRKNRKLSGPQKQISLPDRILFPMGLLSELQLRPRAKLLYAKLQTRGQAGRCTVAELCHSCGKSPHTVRRALQELVKSGWVEVDHPSRVAPIQFALRNTRTPECEPSAVSTVRSRLEHAQYRGEALMHEYLSLLIDSDEYEHNARPGFLVNPLTGERMELDRYYAPTLAFEYQGSQHFEVSDRVPSAEEVAAQQARDLMKETLCARRGLPLVILTRGDLRLSTIRAKVGNRLPVRNLRGQERLIAFLDNLSHAYRHGGWLG